MNHYHQTDTLSLDPALAVSGTGGTSAPEQAAGNADYATWSWETVLASVLNIPISDRSEVTGPPWLTIAQDGQGVPGGHLIWTASWNTKPKSGGTSLRVYLNPALYEGGGAWDRFVNAPSQALSGAAGALPLVPQTFRTAQAALADVTTGIYNLSAQMDLIHHNVTADGTPLQGNATTVMAELFKDLHGTALSLYDQLSNPSYSDAVGAAGDAATGFIRNISSAYGAWSQLAEHSPLGAIVQVLTAIAAPDGNGGFTIPDPENTPFGDLTTPGAWDAVEQQAKSMWLGLLTGNSYAFGGLDVLGRSALSTLVGHYASTTQIVKPVVGPAPPPVTQTPVDGTPNPGGGPGVNNLAVTGGGPRNGPAFSPGTGPPGTGIHAPGGQAPGNHPVLVAAGGGNVPPGPATPEAFGGRGPAQLFTAPGRTAGGPGGTVPGVFGPPIAAPPGTGQNAEADAHRVSAGLRFPNTTGVLAGAIGATPARDGEPVGPAGRDAHPAGRAGAHAHRAPTAGFSLGGGPHGAVLSQAAVPAVAAKPPSVTSSAINTQLTPASTDGTGLPGLPGSPGASPAASSMVLADAGPGAVTTSAMLGGPGAQAGANGPMMLPPGVQGGMGRPGQQGQEQERLAYLPQDEDYWGTGPTLLSPGVDAIDDEADDEPDFEGSWLPGAGVRVVDDADDEPEFGSAGLIVGIGAEASGPGRGKETMSDWRMR